jgi:hypothetical protein
MHWSDSDCRRYRTGGWFDATQRRVGLRGVLAIPGPADVGRYCHSGLPRETADDGADLSKGPFKGVLQTTLIAATG